MKKLFAILFIALLTSCEGNVESGTGIEMDAHKFEHEGNHYIQFKFVNAHGGGVTLDPDYIFQGDTIMYRGNKYIKLK
jgi:hypothetical protein